ncbi:DUF1593 domain-containing protein, partial [Paraglaciecola hydrolytica]
MKFLLILLLSTSLLITGCSNDEVRHRVIVSTDIGGTDPDDFQSMVHLLLYADSIDIEGLISSPFGPGRKQDILDVIDVYAVDYPKLKNHSARYPTADALRQITKQGETQTAPYAGIRQATAGSNWIIERARIDDPRPLNILVWGGIEDLAQALHDAPDILPKLRVYYIGGPNKKWGPDAYQYIADNFPSLFIIESNATYRGWFVGGNQGEDWGNTTFVTKNVAGHGALGDYFVGHLGGEIKMGDTPSLAWLLKGNQEDPSQPGWGGQYVRTWTRSHTVFERLTTAKDEIEEFSVMELVLALPDNLPTQPEAKLLIENLALIGHFDGKGNVRFRYSPKAAKTFTYALQSNIAELHGQTGAITA